MSAQRTILPDDNYTGVVNTAVLDDTQAFTEPGQMTLKGITLIALAANAIAVFRDGDGTAPALWENRVAVAGESSTVMFDTSGGLWFKTQVYVELTNARVYLIY